MFSTAVLALLSSKRDLSSLDCDIKTDLKSQRFCNLKATELTSLNGSVATLISLSLDQGD